MRSRLYLAFISTIAIASSGTAQSVKAGIEAYGRGDYAAALAQWRPLAARGNADAMFDLGQAYRLGRGIPIDLGAAEDWFTRAARLGHVDAQTQLGLLMFQNGNRAPALSWLKKAADKGEPRAQLVYGTALYNGDGGAKRDAILAHSYVAKAAAQGLAPAKTTLAEMDRDITDQANKRPSASLTRNAAVATAPTPKQPREPKPPSNPPAVSKAPFPKSDATIPSSGTWRVQLGAFAQRAAADALYRKLVVSDLLGRQEFLIPVANMTRLQAGPFPTKAEADRACQLLRAKAQPCFVVAGR